MKKFLLHLLIYLIPLPIYLAIVIFIDPYDYFGESHWVPEDIKLNTSYAINTQLWKIIDFKNHPCSRIILGDSRADKIVTDDVKNLTGKDYYNLAFPGGTLIDIIEAFWYADRITHLKEVYIGINFNLYNDYERNDRMLVASRISKNFMAYAFSKTTVTTMFQNVKYKYNPNQKKIGAPDMSFDEFWNYQINVIGKRFYEKYRYPQEYFEDLHKISEYCKSRGIKLVFFVPPNHIEWQKRVADFHLEKEHDIFIRDLSGLGTLINMDVENDFTSEKKNFRDPLHPLYDSMIIHSLWKDIKIAHQSGNAN
jgi:hypothetical protein